MSNSNNRDIRHHESVKDLLETIKEVSPENHDRVVENMENIYQANHLTENGALTDLVTSKEATSDKERVIQTVGAVQHGVPNRERREFIRNALLIGTGALIPVAAEFIVNRINSPDDIDESFVEEILELYVNRPKLKAWSDDLRRAGNTKASSILRHLTTSGDNFVDTYQSLETLESLVKHGQLSDFSRSFFVRAYSHHYRYLGFFNTARRVIEKLPKLRTRNSVLNALLIDSKHMTSYAEFLGSGNYDKKLAEDNLELSKSYSAAFGQDIDAIDRDAFEHAKNISLSCVELKGLHFANLVMSSPSEQEALEALELLDQYSLQMLLSINAENGFTWQTYREFGEVIWWYGRISQIAFIKSWNQLLDRCLEYFYRGAPVTEREELLNKIFHAREGHHLRSPVWISTAILKSMREHLRNKNGAVELSNIIPDHKKITFHHNTGLTRAYNAVAVEYGADAYDIEPKDTLCDIENTPLLSCVLKLQNPEELIFDC